MTDEPGDAVHYVSRGGVKLAAALDAFTLHPAGLVCADLGCSTGGFTDCLLKRGAARVFAVDTAYGQLAWKLRQDERVHVLERTNALHFEPATVLGPGGGCDLVTIDLGWTRQARAVPAAMRWLDSQKGGDIVTLVKPHYEAEEAMGRGRRRKGVLSDAEAEAVVERVVMKLPALGVAVRGRIRSPIPGTRGGNIEHLLHLVVPAGR